MTGMNRSTLNGPKFETVTRGLTDGVKLTGLWIYGSRLWAYDAANVRLMTYTDSLTLPIVQDTSADIQAMGTKNVILKWKGLEGATSYKWQMDFDTDFFI